MTSANPVRNDPSTAKVTKTRAIQVWTLVTALTGVLLGVLWLLDAYVLGNLAVILGFIVAVGWGAIGLLLEPPKRR